MPQNYKIDLLLGAHGGFTKISHVLLGHSISPEQALTHFEGLKWLSLVADHNEIKLEVSNQIQV